MTWLNNGWHGDAVISTILSQQESCWFRSSMHVLPAWILVRYSGFLQHNGVSLMGVNVRVCLCDRLVTCLGCTLSLAL